MNCKNRNDLILRNACPEKEMPLFIGSGTRARLLRIPSAGSPRVPPIKKTHLLAGP